MNFNIERIPDWAHNWCYYFLGVAIATLGLGIYSLFAKAMPIEYTIFLIIMSLVQTATSLTFFWMCRKSLRNN